MNSFLLARLANFNNKHKNVVRKKYFCQPFLGEAVYSLLIWFELIRFFSFYSFCLCVFLFSSEQKKKQVNESQPFNWMVFSILWAEWIHTHRNWITFWHTSIVDRWVYNWHHLKRKKRSNRWVSIYKMPATVNTISGHRVIVLVQECSYGWVQAYHSMRHSIISIMQMMQLKLAFWIQSIIIVIQHRSVRLAIGKIQIETYISNDTLMMIKYFEFKIWFLFVCIWLFFFFVFLLFICHFLDGLHFDNISTWMRCGYALRWMPIRRLYQRCFAVPFSLRVQCNCVLRIPLKFWNWNRTVAAA